MSSMVTVTQVVGSHVIISSLTQQITIFLAAVILLSYSRQAGLHRKHNFRQFCSCMHNCSKLEIGSATDGESANRLGVGHPFGVRGQFLSFL